MTRSKIPWIVRWVMKLGQLSPLIKRLVWRRWYQYLAGYQLSAWRFMNYGYAPLEPGEGPVTLQPEDEADRYAIQLYHRVARGVVLKGQEVLEVGCGRGGGASFIRRYHGPARMTGVDFSANAVQLCQANHRVDGLSFVHGDAEALPFPDRSFDAVINVESSHCYGSMPTFLKEVTRVLRPGGHFLFADLRGAEDRDLLRQQMIATGMTVLEEQDITPNVLEALRLDSPRKLALIEGSVKKRMVGTFSQFAAIEGSEVFAGFKTGAVIYLRYLLRK